jgi:hypothetical protein
MKNNWTASFGCFFFGLTIIVIVITFSGCRSTPMPAVDVKFYSGDSKNGGITRAQEHKTIECKEPEFDEYVCLTYADVKKIMAAMLQCKDWSNTTLMTSRQKKRLYKENKELIHHVLNYERRKDLESPQY